MRGSRRGLTPLLGISITASVAAHKDQTPLLPEAVADVRSLHLPLPGHVDCRLTLPMSSLARACTARVDPRDEPSAWLHRDLIGVGQSGWRDLLVRRSPSTRWQSTSFPAVCSIRCTCRSVRKHPSEVLSLTSAAVCTVRDISSGDRELMILSNPAPRRYSTLTRHIF